MIKIEKASKMIDDKFIFKDISLNVKKQETYLLVGPNGIGKTSLLKSIIGLYSIYSGSITVLGKKITKAYKMNPDIGVYLDTAKILPHSNVLESLSFFVSLYEKSIDDIHDLIYYLHLENELNKTYMSLSSGNKRKLGLLISLINNPELIIWDEPFATLDPEMCSELVDFIFTLKRKGKTILLTTNDLFFADNLYDKIGFFVNASELIEQTRETLIEKYPNQSLTDIYFLIKQSIV